MHSFEMDGDAGILWTEAEQAAFLSKGWRTLTQDEPAPQTIYRVVTKTATGLMVTVPLQRRR